MAYDVAPRRSAAEGLRTVYAATDTTVRTSADRCCAKRSRVTESSEPREASSPAAASGRATPLAPVILQRPRCTASGRTSGSARRTAATALTATLASRSARSTMSRATSCAPGSTAAADPRTCAAAPPSSANASCCGDGEQHGRVEPAVEVARRVAVEFSHNSSASGRRLRSTAPATLEMSRALGSARVAIDSRSPSKATAAWSRSPDSARRHPRCSRSSAAAPACSTRSTTSRRSRLRWREGPSGQPVARRWRSALRAARRAASCSAMAAAATSTVGAVPPRWAGSHQRSSGPAGCCG